jgi:hypothetical protein
MTNTELRNDERKALELLPWYVNGTLAGEERELVGRQVLASLTCRKELERLRRLQELIQRDDAEAVATGRAFERLMARIEASDETARSSTSNSARQQAWTRFALAASLAAAVSVLLWQWTRAPSVAPPAYETLTRSTDVDTVRLRVVFAPQVTESERQALLTSHGLTVVGSPSEEGIVTLAFADGTDRAAIVAALKQDPRIRLVTTPPVSEAP